MAVSDSVKSEAFKRAGGRCECTRPHTGEKSPPHGGAKCPRGFPEVWGWQPYEKVPLSKGGKDSLDNVEVLCQECYNLAMAASAAQTHR